MTQYSHHRYRPNIHDYLASPKKPDLTTTNKVPYVYTLDEAKDNTRIIKGVNALMTVINLLFMIVLFTAFIQSTVPSQTVVLGGMSVFNIFLAAVHGIGIIFAKYLSGETKLLIKEKGSK